MTFTTYQRRLDETFIIELLHRTGDVVVNQMCGYNRNSSSLVDAFIVHEPDRGGIDLEWEKGKNSITIPVKHL